MLLLGVVQEQAAGVAPAVAGSYDLLATEILTSTQTSITFSSLSAYAGTYQHLQLRVAGRTLRNGTDDSLQLTFNGITTANAIHFLAGSGSTVYALGYANEVMQVGAFSMTAANSVANSFGAAIVDILDPFSTNKYKTVRALSGKASDVSAVALSSTSWNNTAAVTTIKIDSRNGNNGFAAGSRFSIYGIKAS